MADKTPIICWDAGHGGYDSGALGPKKREEEDDVLKLVLAAGKKIETDYVCKSVYTRTTDIYESPTKKAKDANDFDADLFVSCHRNDADDESANGFEALLYNLEGLKYELAKLICERMEVVGYRNRGVKVRTDLTVLKKTNMQAIILEYGFMKNKKDNNLFDKKFDEIVKETVDSIAKVMKLEKKKVEPVKPVVSTPKKFSVGDYNDYVVTTANLNVRKGRGTHHDILGTLKKGTKVKVLYIMEYKGTMWGSIDYGKNVGYISLNYVKPV